MKKITFLLAVMAFWAGNSQVVQKVNPSLSYSEAMRVASTSNESQNTAVQAQSYQTMVADAAARGITQSNPVVLRQSDQNSQEQAPCTYANPSNGWENGLNYTGAFGAVKMILSLKQG